MLDPVLPPSVAKTNPTISTNPTPKPINRFLIKLFMTLPGNRQPSAHEEFIAARARPASPDPHRGGIT